MESNPISEIYKKKQFYFQKPHDLNIYDENNSIAGEHFSGKTYFALEKIAKPLLKTGKIKIWMWVHHQKVLKGLLDSGYLHPNQIVYYLDELQDGTQFYVPKSKSIEHFNEFCALILKQRNLHVIFDELHNYMSAQTMAKNLYPVIRDLAANQGVTYTAIWQRISEGHKSVMSNARHKFLFDFDIADQDRYLSIFGTKADLFLYPEQRKYFTECKVCGKNALHHKYNDKLGNHKFDALYPVLDLHSFIYKDDKFKESMVYNGGI